MADDSKAIVVHGAPRGEPPPRGPARGDGVKVTVDLEGRTMIFDIGHDQVTLTLREGDTEEIRPLPMRVVAGVRRTVESLVVVATTAFDPLCSSCGHERCLHVRGQACAGDMYAGGKLCNCAEFRP